MKSMNGFKYSNRVIKELGDNYVILHNANNVRTMRITRELFDVIDYMCIGEIGLDEMLTKCETEEDKVYLQEKCKELLENKIIREKDDDTEYIELGIRIDWDITNRCNLKCKHCCVDAGNTFEDLKLDTMLEMADKIISVNPKEICISGGEPLVRTDFTKIVLYIRERYKNKLFLMTNGTLINDEMASFIVHNFDGVSVSIDGIDEETCASVRGAGTFEKTISGIERLNQAGIKFLSASMLLTKLTANKRKEFKELCERLHAEPMCRALTFDGRASREMKDLVATDEEICNGRLSDSEQVSRYACGAAIGQYQIDYKGDIFPCQSLMFDDFNLGNVVEIENLYHFIRERGVTTTEGYKRLEKLFPENLDICKGCNKHIFCFTCLRGIYYNMEKLKECNRKIEFFDRCFV